MILIPRHLVTASLLSVLGACLSAATWAEPIKITYAHTGPNPGLERMVALFNAEHDDIKAEYQSVANFWEALTVQIAGGVGPDVFFMHPHYIRSFVEGGLVADLTPFVNKDSAGLRTRDYFPLALAQSTVNGRYYSWPYGLVETGRVLYNADMFDAAGLATPDEKWNWQQYAAIARRLTLDPNGDGQPDQWGSSRMGFREIVQYNLAGGGEFYSDDLKSFFSKKQPALEALNRARELIETQGTSLAVTGATQWNQGTLAMLLTHLPGALDFGWRVRERFTAASTMQPLHPNGNRRILVHSNMFAINPNSKHKEEAWKFVAWAAGPGGYARAGKEAWGVAQLMPPRRDVALSSYFTQIEPGRGPVLVNSALSVEIVSKYGVPEIVPKQHAEVQRIFNTDWAKVERGELSTVAFYETITPLAEAALRGDK